VIVFFNGRFVPEEHALVSVFDRSFMYGDGLFETLPVRNGKLFRWAQHLGRLERGAALLRIRMPFSGPALAAAANELIARNNTPEAILRVHLSRGPGLRGYSPEGAEKQLIAMTLHPQSFDDQKPLCWRLITSSLRVQAADPLGSLKSCNKLHQIMARAEAQEAGVDDALLLNTHGELAEATASNLFWIKSGSVHTTPVSSGALPGVTRAVVIEICKQGGTLVQEQSGPLDLVHASEGVFLTLSSHGIVEVTELDGLELPRSSITRQLHDAYRAILSRETGS
jgi:branched-chain amino acid aminotransferase